MNVRFECCVGSSAHRFLCVGAYVCNKQILAANLTSTKTCRAVDPISSWFVVCSVCCVTRRTTLRCQYTRIGKCMRSLVKHCISPCKNPHFSCSSKDVLKKGVSYRPNSRTPLSSHVIFSGLADFIDFGVTAAIVALDAAK